MHRPCRRVHARLPPHCLRNSARDDCGYRCRRRFRDALGRGGAVGVVDAYCPSAIPWPVEGSATESLNQTLEAVLATAGQDLDKSWQTSTDDSSSSNGHSMQVDV